MAVFKATQNKSDSAGKFKATKNRSYDSTLVYDWETKNKESYDALEKYRQRINSGGYLSADDLTAYRKALDSYVETSTSLRGFSKAMGQGKDDDDAWTKTIADMESGYQGISDYFSQWKTEDAFKASLAAQKDRDEKLKLDTNAYRSDLEALEAQRDALVQELDAADSSIGTANVDRAAMDLVGRIDALEKQIQEKKLYLSEADRLQEGVRLASVSANKDFHESSGYVSTEYGEGFSWDKLLNNDYGLGYEDLTYEYINNQNGIRGEIDRKASIYGKGSGDGESRFKANGYDLMHEDEIAIYNYYYAKEGKQAAEKYLNSIQETLNSRKAAGMYENLEDNALLELAFGVAAGLDQFESGMKGLADAFSGNDEYKAPSATQMASGMVREDLADAGPNLPKWLGGSSLGQVGYDAVTTTSNMLPSILTSTAVNLVAPGAGSIVGTGLLGASAGGNAYREMINLGYDKGQARSYAALVGGSEALLQYALGGISSLGGGSEGIFQTMAGKLLPHVDNAFARVAIKLGSNMLDEGLEEGLQEILNPWFQNMVLNADAKVNWSEVAYSSLLGALTAGVMEGGGTVSGEVNTYTQGRKLLKADISAERLAELGKTFAADTEAYKLAGKVNENTSAYTIGRLFNEIGATMTEQNVNDITNALVAKGWDEATAKKNAEALAYVIEGGQLTDSQIAFIEANETLAEAARATLFEANTTWNQRAMVYNDAVMALAQEQTGAKSSRTNPAGKSEDNAPTTDTVDTASENGAEGASEADTGPAKVKSIAAIKNKRATVALEDGTEADVRDVDLDPDDGVRIETIASIDGISATDANFILKTLRENNGASAQMDSLGAKDAYRYGFYGFSKDLMTKQAVFANSLTEAQRNAIYEVGQKARQQQIEKASPKTTSKQRGIYFDHGGGNVVEFKDADKNTLTEDKRKAGVQAALILNKLGIGGNIYFYESYRNANGQLVYKDANGIEQKAPNGWYSPGDGSIHIDLNAGKEGHGFVMFTLAHELTHFIEQWSPAKYKILADFLIENYEKGQSMDALVKKKQDALSKNRREAVSYDEAYSEVIADSMEAMLADGNVLEKLIELKAKDQSLFAKMKQFFDNLLAKIRNAYKGQTPDSAEGKAVLEMTESIEKIQQLFAEALVEASENFQSAEKNTTQEGGVGNETAVQRSERIVDQIRSSLPKIMALNSVYTIDASNATPYTSDWKTDEKSGHAVFKYQGGSVNRPGFGRVVLSKRGAVQTVHHGNGPAKQAAFPAIKAVIEHGIEIYRNNNHNNQGYDTITFSAPITFFGKEAPLAVVVKSFESANADKTFYIHEICDAEGNYIQMAEEDSNKKTSSTNFVEPTSTVSAADGISPKASILDEGGNVNTESSEALDVEFDANTESVAPSVQLSERTWTESDYVQEREKAAKEIAKAIGVSEKKAKAYIDSVNSIAKMIANDRVRLDYFSSPGKSSFVGNVEYGGSFDFSTLCKKRRLLTGTFTAIQRALPNTALTADEILDIRNRMKEAGLEVSCGLCYVEGSRANMGQFAKEFLKLYKQYYPDSWQPNMADVNTPDGIEWVRINHPEVYEQYEYFWNHYGTLKEGDKNLFASQQKPKQYQLHTEYKGEILEKFNDDDNVEEKNLNGGIRLQSFSDFEIVHLIDTMQIIMDMARVGLAGQAYTKVPDFAWALGDTGLKINLSLIAKGVDKNGNLIFDDVEGMPIDTAVKLRNRYSKNVGTILVAFNDEQLLAAMADERVDFIIPFHRSQWKKSQYGAMGLPAKTKDYTYMQNEKHIKPQYHEYRGRMVKDKATNYMPNEYWDFSKSGKENAVAYLEMCARNNKRPKFYKLLQNNGDGSYSMKADGSTDGYWKLLIDFKMYDNAGVGSPQMPVKPDFNMDEATRMLDEYSGGHSNFPVAQGIVDSFVNEYKDSHKGLQFSDRDSDGNQLSEEQQEFFKDSKVRDKKGNLLVVYHGTTANFNTFKKGDVGFHFGTKGAARGRAGYGKNVTIKEVYLNITYPVVFDEDLGSWDADYRLTRELYDRGILTHDEAMSVLRTDDGRYKRTTESANKKLASVLMAKGYDGIAYQNTFETKKATTSYIAFASNQAKEITNLNPTSNPDIRYSERIEDSVSNRSLLANAFEGVAQNDIEKRKIQEYKSQISLINAEERKLSELNQKIKDLSFANGPKDTKAIRALRDEATKTANRINTMDKILLRLEASKPLQDVLTREKEMVRKREQQKGKEALEAYREKATKTQRELLEKWQESRKKGIDSRQRTAMRHKIQNVVKELNDLLLNESKKRHVPDSMKNAVADALSLVNMDTVGAEERAAKYAALIAKETDPDKIAAYTATMENILRQGDKMGQRLKELRDAYEEIQESDDPDIANAYDPVIAGNLKELHQSIGNTSLRNMTIEQLSDVYDMYKMVLTRVRDANKTLLENIKENISSLASRVIGEVRMTGGEHKQRLAMLDPVRSFLWNNLKPVYAMEHIGSATLTKVFNNVRAGEDTWAKDVTEAREYYLAQSKKYGYDKWDFKKKYRFQSASELEFELTLEQILSLYAYSKRDQAADHLRLGGFVFDSNIETYKEKGGKLKYRVNTADAHQITPEILADITGKLSKEQMGFVDEMQAYLSTTMGAKGNDVTMKMYGVKLFKEKFYFPLKSAKQFMFEQNEVSGEVKIKNSGFTNKVVAKANNPVILSNFMEVWSGHVNDMSMYHAFVLPLEDFNRVFNYNSPKKENRPPVSVKGTIQSAYSPAAVSYVKNLITDLNGGARTDSRTGIMGKLIGLHKKGAVFASLSVVVQQPSAIARAAALVDTKYFIGPKVDHKRHKALWEEVKRYAPVAIIKEMGYFDTNMGKSTQDYIIGQEYSGFKEKMKALVTDSNYRDEILSKAPALADEIAWCGIWEAVKRETQAQHPGLDVRGEPFLMLAGSRFTEVITKTQVYDSVLSRSANMRSKDTGMKMVTAFMAEPTTSINMIADALLQGKRGNRKYCRATIGAVIASQIINSILVSFVYAGRDDDEDETYAEKYIGTLSREVLDSLNPATYIPFIKDIVSIVQGYDVERSDMAIISDLVNAWRKLSSDNLSAYRKVEEFAGSIAQLFGLPVKNIMRDARGIYQTIMSFVSGPQTTAAGIGYAIQGAVTGKDVSNQKQLYEAHLSGDKAQIARVESRYKDQSSIASAIRKALRENDPRILEAAQAVMNGNGIERANIAREIAAEGHFDLQDIQAAINAEIDKLRKEAKDN